MDSCRRHPCARGSTLVRVVGVVWLLAMACAGTAQAGTPAEEEAALFLFQEGRDAFDGRRYEEAVEHFEGAWEVLQNDFLRYYLGHTGTCPAASPSPRP